MKGAVALSNDVYDENVGGYKLYTYFKEIKTDLGRMFIFAYGSKENGEVFSHMAFMYIVFYIISNRHIAQLTIIINLLLRFILPLFFCELLYNKNNDSIKILYDKKAIFPFIINFSALLLFNIININLISLDTLTVLNLF